MLNRALNIPGFLRCVPENNDSHCPITLRFIIHSISMYYILILHCIFLTNFCDVDLYSYIIYMNYFFYI